MRKLIIIAASLVAIAALIAIPFAAAASTDAHGVVTVSKGEIMAQFPGMNEKAFQTIAMADGQSLTGSNVFTATTTTGVGCSDGTVQTHFRSTHIARPITLCAADWMRTAPAASASSTARCASPIAFNRS